MLAVFGASPGPQPNHHLHHKKESTMAIVLKHGVNPAVALTASFGSGQAAKRQELEKEQRTVQTAQRARDAQRSFQAAQAEKSRVFSREQNEAARALQLEDRGAARALQLEDRETMRAQGLEDEERQYSARQRQDYNALSDAYEQAVESGDFTDDELKDIKRKVQMKQMGLKDDSLGRLDENEPLSPEERIAQNTQVMEDGTILGVDEKGKVYVVKEPKSEKPEKPDTLDRKMIANMFTESRSRLKREAEGKEPSADAVRKDVEAQLDQFDQVQNRQAGGDKESTEAEAAIAAVIDPPTPAVKKWWERTFGENMQRSGLLKPKKEEKKKTFDELWGE